MISDTHAIHSDPSPALHGQPDSILPSPSPLSEAGSASSSASEDEQRRHLRTADPASSRPRLGSRKTSGSMIVSRDQATGDVIDTSDFEEGDVRTMSPRRNSQQVDELSDRAREDMMAQARTLQASLQAIVDRVEEVKREQEKLEGGNKFLQSYIGELMQTSKITSSGAINKKGKGRSGK